VASLAPGVPLWITVLVFLLEGVTLLARALTRLVDTRATAVGRGGAEGVKAKHYLSSDLLIERAGAGRRVIRFVVGALAELASEGAGIGPDIAAADKAFVVLRDRWSVEIVHELGYGTDFAAADLGKKAVDDDLARLEIRRVSRGVRDRLEAARYGSWDALRAVSSRRGRGA
jgi:hypothetical protein